MKLREALFKGISSGCTNHGCVVRGNFKGIGSNGLCKCLVDMSRTQLTILQARIKRFGEVEVGNDLES